uniref:Transcriptional regulator n=1 Tax=Steinernema glaseri TaxID=37863 RepID=A0A1I7Y7G8_9BILA
MARHRMGTEAGYSSKRSFQTLMGVLKIAGRDLGLSMYINFERGNVAVHVPGETAQGRLAPELRDVGHSDAQVADVEGDLDVLVAPNDRLGPDTLHRDLKKG